MATNTFTGTGNWSDNARWSLGRPPTIANADKIVIAASAVCTLDGVYSGGDDTTTALTTTGIIKASRSVTSGLTLRGAVVPSTTGGFDFGSEADPIPENITATLVYNDSATITAGKYPLSISGAGMPGVNRFWGAAKTAMSSVSAALVSDLVYTVEDITGWKNGDIVFFGPASDTSPNTAGQPRAISSVTPTTGTAGTVTLSAALAEASPAGRNIVNITRNVRVVPVNSTASSISFAGTTAPANSLELGNCEFVGSSFNTGSLTQACGLSVISRAASVKAINGIVAHNVLSVSGSTVTSLGVGVSGGTQFAAGGASQFIVEAPVIYTHTSTIVRGFTAASQGLVSLLNPIFGPYATAPFSVSALVSTPRRADITNPTVLGYSGSASSLGMFLGAVPQVSMQITGGKTKGFQRLLSSGAVSVGELIFNGSDFGSSNGAAAQADSINLPADISGKFSFLSCTFPPQTGVIRSTAGLASVNSNLEVIFKNKNNDATLQYRYTYGGEQIRDNAVFRRGASSVRFDCWYSANPLTYSFNIKVGANQTINLRGSTRYTATYGTTAPPKVTISGLGITPVVFTDPATGADTWHDYSLTATNPNAYPGEFTVIYTGQSAANSTGAYCYFDGVVDSPWVDSARHYGYLYGTGLAYQTVDPDIAVSDEATVLAYPVAVNHGTGTVSVTGDVTATQIGDYLAADIAQTANQGEAVHYTLAVGGAFTTSYEVVPGSGATITGTYTDAVGVHVSADATLPVSGCRVQLYDVTVDIELDNREVTGASYSYPIVYDTYTAGHVLRLRVAFTDAASAKLPQEVFATLTSGGAVFTVPDEDDTVYAANGIDGSTCDVSGGGEFTADYPNLQIDVSDVDGVTSVQRVYAWSAWANTTAQGIRLMFAAVEALDTLNYVIHQDVVDAKFDNVNVTPVLIAGGYIRRADGSTVIAAASGSIQMDPGRAYVAGGASLAADVWASPSRTLTDGTAANVLAVKAKTDNLPAAPAAVGDIPTAAQVADKVLGRNLAGGSDGGRTVKDALRANRNKSQLAGGTLTVYQEDDATPAWTADVTTATRDPISGIDPA